MHPVLTRLAECLLLEDDWRINTRILTLLSLLRDDLLPLWKDAQKPSLEAADGAALLCKLVDANFCTEFNWRSMGIHGKLDTIKYHFKRAWWKSKASIAPDVTGPTQWLETLVGADPFSHRKDLGLFELVAARSHWGKPRLSVPLMLSQQQWSFHLVSDSLLNDLPEELLAYEVGRRGGQLLHAAVAPGAGLANLTSRVRWSPPADIQLAVCCGNGFDESALELLQHDCADLLASLMSRGATTGLALPCTFPGTSPKMKEITGKLRCWTELIAPGCLQSLDDVCQRCSYQKDGIHVEALDAWPMAAAIAEIARGLVTTGTRAPSLELMQIAEQATPPAFSRPIGVHWRQPWLFQTYFATVPPNIVNNRATFAHSLKVHTFNDAQCEAFLRENFGHRYVNRFQSFWCGAHKAGFVRYCWLFCFGGVYVDVKTLFMHDVEAFLADKPDDTLVTVLVNKRCHNGFIVCGPSDPIIHKAMEHAMEVPLDDLNNDYLLLCRHLWRIVREEL